MFHVKHRSRRIRATDRASRVDRSTVLLHCSATAPPDIYATLYAAPPGCQITRRSARTLPIKRPGKPQLEDPRVASRRAHRKRSTNLERPTLNTRQLQNGPTVHRHATAPPLLFHVKQPRTSHASLPHRQPDQYLHRPARKTPTPHPSVATRPQKTKRARVPNFFSARARVVYHSVSSALVTRRDLQLRRCDSDSLLTNYTNPRPDKLIPSSSTSRHRSRPSHALVRRTRCGRPPSC